MKIPEDILDLPASLLQRLDFGSATIHRVALDEFKDAGIDADVLRLDRIHPVISGNKWFKLKYHLAEAIKQKASTVLTFGGSWSNHIVATAWACKETGLKSVGVIRGEEPKVYSHTLQTASGLGMKLVFVSRDQYDALNTTSASAEFLHCHAIPGDAYQVPAGGEGPLGVKGASEIIALADIQTYSHVACSIGTATMFAGLVTACSPEQMIIGIPALKGFRQIPEELSALIQSNENKGRMHIAENFHFGGYARKNQELIQSMNKIYAQTCIETDFVYTGKLFYGCITMAKDGFFPASSCLLIIHSGGLQGNSSLSPGILDF